MPATTSQAKQSDGGKRRKSKGSAVDEEAELEARLFGKKRKSSKKATESDDEDTGMGWMQDSEVSCVGAGADKSFSQ